MSFKGICHQSCTDEIEKQIRNAVAELYDNVKIETVVLHENDKISQSDTQGVENCQDNVNHHSFLVTVEAGCRYENEFLPDSHEVNPNDMFDLEELFDCTDELDTDTTTLLTGEKSPFVLSLPKSQFADAAVYNNQFAGTRIDSTVESSLFENLSRTGDKKKYMDTMDLSAGIMEGFDDSVFPLSSDELHETINEQLDKSPPVEEWQNPLFKDVPKAGMDTVATNMDNALASASRPSSMMIVNELASSLSSQSQQQYQSNEISSSWDAVAISTSHYHQSTTLIPQQIIHPNYYSNSDHSTSFTGLHSANLLLPTLQQQQAFCPANLPAVSALITSGGASFNWSYPNAHSSGGVIKPTLIRLKKIVQEQKRKNQNVSSRPSMLLPKITSFPSRTLAIATSSSESEMLSTEIPKLRSRKASHTSQPQPAQTTASVIDSSNRSNNTPEGFTYQTWIIQEGLKKPREKMKQQKKAGGLLYGKGKRGRQLDKQEQRDGDARVKKIPVVTQKENAVRYVCPICGKSYGTANGIKYHAENGHGPKNVHVCNICNKEYGSRHGLATHKKTHEIQAAGEALGKPI